MKDKYLGMICLSFVASLCIIYRAEYASEIVTGLCVALAAVIRD